MSMVLWPGQFARTRANIITKFTRFQYRLFSSALSRHTEFDKYDKIPLPIGYKQVMPHKDDTIIVSMSSGVDSSVTALLYSKIYPNVKGVFMANWKSFDGEGSTKACTLERDWEEVQQTCQQLNIPCERVNFEQEYWSDVFVPMLDMYKKGWTPNPDVSCNKYVKFGKMIEHLSKKYEPLVKVKEGSKWWLATGHYSRVLQSEATGEFNLFRAGSVRKDQSYYLNQMPTEVLSRVLLPMGHYDKSVVRKIAQDYDLVTKEKRDSAGLCFVSQTGQFRDFLSEYLDPTPGDIVTADGKVWGQHKGLWHATIGQRTGVCMPQGSPEYAGIWLVSDKNIEKNQLIISRKDDYEAFHRDVIMVEDWIWMSEKKDQIHGLDDIRGLQKENLNVQIRSLMTPVTIKKFHKDKDKDNVRIVLSERIRGIACGQHLVLYEGDKVIGSGIIAGMSNT